MEHEISHVDDIIVNFGGCTKIGTRASEVEIVRGTPGKREVVPGIADCREDTVHRYEDEEKKKEMSFPTFRHFGISRSPRIIPSPWTKKANGGLKSVNPPTRLNRGALFGQEIVAVSVRKAKKIASEVDRKRTNRITLLFASSMGFLLSPAQGVVEQ